MRGFNKMLLVLAGLALVGVYSCSDAESAEQVATEIKAENVVVADYSIEGMVCAMGCAKTIQDELSEMNGIANCEVSFENGTAHIEYDQTQLSEDDLIAVIEGLADGKYSVKKEKEAVEEVSEDAQIEESEESEESLTEVVLPSFEMPNLLELLLNQL